MLTKHMCLFSLAAPITIHQNTFPVVSDLVRVQPQHGVAGSSASVSQNQNQIVDYIFIRGLDSLLGMFVLTKFGSFLHFVHSSPPLFSWEQ